MTKAKTTKRRADEPQAWPDFAETVVAGELAWGKIYWLHGQNPKGSSHRNEVSDPPNSGWSHVFVMPQGGRRVRLFCPYTFYGYTVTADSAEFDSLDAPSKPIDVEWAVRTLREKWKQFDGYGMQRDFDTAARIFRALDAEVPMKTLVPTVEGEEVKRGGKPAAPKLLKPVARESRRGQLLVWFMDSLGEARSVREAMAEFGTTRSNVLTMLYQLNKDHGIGYVLAGDAADIEMPADCKKLFG